METALRPLRGACQCGRNRYIIVIPQDNIKEAQVCFNTNSSHQIPLGTPLAAYIRVPLSWYHSTTQAFFPDETHATIRRVYTHPSAQHAKRHFCGYCGTSLSYWSEQPWSEADFINLTLGSLVGEDLRDLEDMGLLPDEPDAELTNPAAAAADASGQSHALRQHFGVPWFEALVKGSRLASLRVTGGIHQSRDGQVEVDWEVVEFPGPAADATTEAVTPSKRKLEDRDDMDVAV